LSILSALGVDGDGSAAANLTGEAGIGNSDLGIDCR
jgi:hypothetical protein